MKSVLVICTGMAWMKEAVSPLQVGCANIGPCTAWEPVESALAILGPTASAPSLCLDFCSSSLTLPFLLPLYDVCLYRRAWALQPQYAGLPGTRV